MELEVAPDPQPPNEAPATPTPSAVTSRELFGGARLLQIEHNGEIYTLRVTRNDRLILTK